jgi:hypothetical protein
MALSNNAQARLATALADPTAGAEVTSLLNDVAGLNIVQGALNTVGAGAILAAAVNSGLLLRGGAQTAPFIDTTDTGTVINASDPGLNIGQTFLFTYQNATPWTATLTGGTGVNAGATFGTVGPGGWATYLFTLTAANTFSVAAVNGGLNFGGLPGFQLTTGTTLVTFAAGQLTGAQDTTYTSTAVTPGSIATRTATQMFADVPGAFVGMQWVVRIVNGVATNSMTITAGAGVTLSGKTTHVITPFGFNDYLCTFTTATAMTMQFVGAGVGTTG